MTLRTIRQTAREAGLPEYLVRQLARTGQIPTLRAGNRVYINTDTPEEDIAALFSRGGNQPEGWADSHDTV